MFENVDLENGKEQDVIVAVINEIKTFGDNTKKQFDEMNKAHFDLQEMVKKGIDGGLDEKKFQKLADDISTRQVALDEFKAAAAESERSHNERVDSIEVALKRIGKTNSESGASYEDAKNFQLAAISSRNQDMGFEAIEKLGVNVEEFEKYCKAIDPWIRKYGGNNMHQMDVDAVKALQVGVDPDGGFNVTPAMSSRIIKKLFETDPIRQLATVESISTGAIEWMVDLDEAGAEWETETVATDNKETPRMDKKRIVVHPLATRPKATQTLLEDSGINVQNWLADKVANKFMRTEGAAFVSGDGVGKPRGILSYATGTTYGTVEQIDSGAADAVTAAGLIKLKYSLQEYYLNRGIFIMNRATVAEIMQLTNAVTGDFIWKPGFQKDSDATILNLPVKMSYSMPVSAANALSVALADWKEAYMVVDRLGITMQRDPYTVKPFVEFYTRKRVGGDVVNYDAIKIGKCST